jgi:iron complex outermembrane receptor protein
VINIISKSAAETQGFHAEAGTGDLLRQNYALRYGGMMAPNISYRVYGKFLDHNSENLPSGAKAADDWDRSQFGFRMDADAQTDGKLTLQGDYYRGTEGFVGGGESDVSGSNVLGRWSRTLGNGSDLSLQLYYDRAHLHQPVAASAFNAAGIFTDDLNTYDLDFQHHLKALARHEIIWGFGYRVTEDSSQSAPGLSFTPPNLRQELVSGFVQDEITLRPGVTVTLGTKVEDTHYTGTEVEPTLRGQWAPSPDSLWWAAISRAVRTPSRIDHDLRQPAQGALIVLKGGQDFVAETLIAYETGYRRQVTQKLFASLAAFYNDYDKVRSLSMTPVTLLPFVFANGLEGHTYGGELTATYEALDWWRLTLGYNLLKESLRVAPGQSDFNNALNETADPQQQASLRSTMDLKGGLEFDTNLRWVDQLIVNNVGKVAVVPSYTELDARIGWRVTRNWDLSLVGQNLLHKQHPEFGVPSPTRVELGRSVFVKSTWQF